MSPVPAALRDRIRRLERGFSRPEGAAMPPTLPFGVAAMDAALPEAGLSLAGLHEVAGGGMDEVHGASAALFAAGILARLSGPVLWCAATADLFPPGLAAVGLHPDRVIYATAAKEAEVLAAMEEGLRHAGLSAVAGELTRLPMITSRRLALAAEASGTLALVVRRRPEGRAAEAAPNAAATRWRITPLPSPALPGQVPGLGPPLWRVELTRCRGGEAGEWIMEGCDAQGRLTVPAELADRQAAPWWRSA